MVVDDPVLSVNTSNLILISLVGSHNNLKATGFDCKTKNTKNNKKASDYSFRSHRSPTLVTNIQQEPCDHFLNVLWHPLLLVQQLKVLEELPLSYHYQHPLHPLHLVVLVLTTTTTKIIQRLHQEDPCRCPLSYQK